jgi:glycosyltransferase involved in cell wall biosynthesis
MLLSIIIPIYNEKEKLAQLISNLKENFVKHQIIIVDDGSNDGSTEYLKDNNSFDNIYLSPNKGKGNAIQIGLKKVKYQSVLLIDGDLEIDLFSLKKNIILKKQTILIGNRWVHNDKINIQRLANYILNAFFNFLYKTNFSDILCCVKLIPTEVIKSFNLKSNGFDIETEIMAKLSLANERIIEIPVKYSKRTHKEGKKIKFIDSIPIIKKMLSIRFNHF